MSLYSCQCIRAHFHTKKKEENKKNAQMLDKTQAHECARDFIVSHFTDSIPVHIQSKSIKSNNLLTAELLVNILDER